MGLKYKYVSHAPEGEKIAPQAKEILDALHALASEADGEAVERDALVKVLEDSGVLKTRQPVLRVVAYYQPQFVAAGLIEVIKDAKAPKPKKEPKAKKAKKGKNVAADETVDEMEITDGDDSGEELEHAAE